MHSRYWPSVYVGLGLLVIGSSLWHLTQPHQEPLLSLHIIADLTLTGGAGVGIIYGGLWQWRHGADAGQSLRSFGWLLTGVLLFTGVSTAVLYVGSTQVMTAELLEAVHIAVAVGAAAGLLVGSTELWAITQSRTAARAEARANTLEEEQERIVHVNELLRHYVLNSLTVIGGYIERESGDGRPDRVAVEARIDTIETLIEHTRALSTALQDDAQQTTYDLEATVSETVAEIDPPQTVRIEIPAETPAIDVNGSFERALGLFFGAFFDALDSGSSVTITTRPVPSGVSLVFSTGAGETAAADVFETVGPETDLKFTLAIEFIESIDTLTLTARDEAYEIVVDTETTSDPA